MTESISVNYQKVIDILTSELDPKNKPPTNMCGVTRCSIYWKNANSYTLLINLWHITNNTIKKASDCVLCIKDII